MIPRLLDISSSEQHCGQCIVSIKDQPMLECAAIIFLDMDGVMICNRVDVRMQEKFYFTRIQMFGDRKHSPLEVRIAEARYLFPEQVSLVMKTIKKVQEQGLKCGIVISSDWGKDGTTLEVCSKMFASQPFSDFIIGCTPHSSSASKVLTQRGRDIEAWLKAHENVKKQVIFDDIPIEKKGERLTKLGRSSVLVRNLSLSQDDIRLGLQILKIDALHCRYCLMFKEEPSLLLKDKVILLIEDKLPNYITQRLSMAGIKAGHVVRGPKDPENKEWIGRLRKKGSFDEAASEWLQTHQVEHYLKIPREQLAVEAINKSISNLGLFPNRVPDPSERHCRFCIFRKNELDSLRKKSWIFLDIKGVLAFSELPYRLNEEAIRLLMTLISKVKNPVAIVICDSLRLDFTTDQVCNELFAKQPFGPLIMGRTASLYEEDPEYKTAKETGTLSAIRWPIEPRGNGVYNWRVAHQLHFEGRYVVLTSILDPQDLDTGKIFTNGLLEEKIIQKALFSLH